jgi:hypothetical protein
LVPQREKPNQETSVFQIEIDGKRYTALSVGRDFTSQGRDNNLRKEKWPVPFTSVHGTIGQDIFFF